MLVILPLLTSFAVPMAQPAVPVSHQAEGELVVLYGGGLDALLTDPKDAGLRAVARLLAARIEELPEELDAPMPMPPDARVLLERLLLGPVALRCGTVEAADFPFFAQLELAGSEEQSKALAQRFTGLLGQLGMPATEADERGLVPLETPVPSAFGAFRDAFVLSVGELQDSKLDFGVTGLPAGVTPSMYGRLDIGGLLGLAEGFGAAGDEEFEQMVDLLDLMGIGESDLRWSLGADDARAYSVLRMPGLAAEMRASGMLPEQPISRRSIAAVPRDATWGSLGVNNLKAGLDLLRNLMGDELAEIGLEGDVLEQLAERTGVHLERDVLDQLGTSFGIYASDTTGGGGWLSVVCFAELSGSEQVAQSVARLEDLLNSLAAEEADGYVQVRRQERDGATWSTLTFPGLPVPLEPTWTVAEGFFLFGMTPQACAAALAHVRAGAPSVLDNPRYAEQLSGAPDELYALGFFDTQRFLSDGYGLASLACSALANATRSRTDAARDAGNILPPYAALAAGAKAWVTTTRVEGDDLVEESRLDRSWMVNGTALAGFVASSPLLLLVPLAGAGAWLGVQSDSMAMLEAEQAYAFEEFEEEQPAPRDPREQAAQDILALHYAAAEFAVLNGGEYPGSLHVLVQPDENGVTYLGTTELPVDPWGNDYHYAPPGPDEGMPRIVCLGADGAEGGADWDADITNQAVLERKLREAQGGGGDR